MMESGMETENKARLAAYGGERPKPLRQVVAEIDQDILRLLMRRQNLLAKIRKNGRLNPAEEKFLRESWQAGVARVSRDATLSSQFFTLMQRVSFLPRPEAEGAERVRRDAFNLAPSTMPARIHMSVPPSSMQTRAWLYMACAAGQPLRVDSALQSDADVDFVQGLAQMGGAITREDNAIIVRKDAILATPDKVIHVGESAFNFYIFLAHYLGRHSHCKMTGSRELQMADMSALDAIMPAFGARFVHLVPTGTGLPVRLEASGMLPPGIAAGQDFPADFAIALLLASPFYEMPFSIDLAKHPAKESILAHALPILEKCGAMFSLQGDAVSIEPCALAIDARPPLYMETELAIFMLAIAAVTGGEAVLQGQWPGWPETDSLWRACADAAWKRGEAGISCNYGGKPLLKFAAPGIDCLPAYGSALMACLAACAALRGGEGKIAPSMLEDNDALDFLRVCGLKADEEGILARDAERRNVVYNAPAAAWAIAMAVAACARTGKDGWPLGNPGIVTGLWPQFWSFYNSLPSPVLKSGEKSEPVAPKKRRRIVTSAVAVPPEIREEDWRM